MQIALDQLTAHLQRSLRPLYVLHGNEALLLQEAADAIRAAARQQGFGERSTHTVSGAHFDWSAVQAACNSLSLFSARQIVDLLTPSSRAISVWLMPDFKNSNTCDSCDDFASVVCHRRRPASSICSCAMNGLSASPATPAALEIDADVATLRLDDGRIVEDLTDPTHEQVLETMARLDPRRNDRARRAAAEA